MDQENLNFRRISTVVEKQKRPFHAHIEVTSSPEIFYGDGGGENFPNIHISYICQLSFRWSK